MPIPVFPSAPVPSVTATPYYLRHHQDWAIEQERMRHAQAVYWVGEWAVWFLMWHVVDFEAGLVGRCTTCRGSSGGLDDRIGAVYNQPTKNKCPNCFGTNFEGGYRARIVRPTIFSDTDESERLDRRGSVHPDDVTIESIWDFRVLGGDYVVRSDNSRWQLRTPQRVTVRTGFEHPDQVDNSISYGSIRAGFEEAGTVAYMLPPADSATIRTTLSVPMRHPQDFGAFEDIRGPLIPPHIQD